MVSSTILHPARIISPAGADALLRLIGRASTPALQVLHKTLTEDVDVLELRQALATPTDSPAIEEAANLARLVAGACEGETKRRATIGEAQR
jgi:hypothetical protein